MRIYLAFILLIFLNSCDCPTGIETPRETEPVDFSKVRYFNALTDFESIGIAYEAYPLLDSLSYEQQASKYLSSPAGSSKLFVCENPDSLIILNAPTKLDTNTSYDMIFFGKRNSVRVKIFDTQEKSNESMAALAIVNAAQQGGEEAVEIKIFSNSSNYQFDLDYLGAGVYKNIDVGTYRIEAYSKKSGLIIASAKDISLSAGDYRLVVLRGDSDSGTRGVELVVR
jgi:hypothetical protein